MGMKWGYMCFQFLWFLIYGGCFGKDVFQGDSASQMRDLRSEIQSPMRDNQYFSISPARNYFSSVSPGMKFLSPVFYEVFPGITHVNPVFYESKVQFPPPFNADYYERFMKSHFLALAPCIDQRSLQNLGQANVKINSPFGFCTSASSCLSSGLSDLLSEEEVNSPAIWEIINAGSRSLRPTCIYLSKEGALKSGICCKTKNSTDVITDLDTSHVETGSKKEEVVRNDSDDTHQLKTVNPAFEKSPMDRGHIFSRPGLPPEAQGAHETQIVPNTDSKDIHTSIRDSDSDSDSYPFWFFPTHPPLPTHSPDITNKPWWVRQPTTTTRRPTSTNQWWQFETSTTKPPRRWEGTSTPRTTTYKWWVTTRPTTDVFNWWETTKTTTTTTEKPTTIPVRWWEKPWRDQGVTTTTTTPKPSPVNFGDVSCSPSYFKDASSLYEPKYDKGTRITGGGPVVPHTFPWIALIYLGTKHVCGGSLIDDVHVLTAAHCVATLNSWQMSQLKVVLGMHYLRQHESSTQEYGIKTVIKHKDYSRSLLYNDVAILTLNGKVRFTQEVRPICLYSGNDNFAGDHATVAGWGSLFEGGRQLDTPRKVHLQIWSNAECGATYGRAAPGGIVSSYLCAGKQGKDACSGDSGGPIVKKIGGVWNQIGIVSWGIGCGKGHYPGVYSRISTFLPWIKKVKAKY